MNTIKFKSILILNILFALYINALAQKPEIILGPTKVNKSPEYYIEQEKLWKAEVNKNKKNATAWYNYYRSVRYQIFGVTTKSSLEEIKMRRTKIIDEMEKAIPNTFEFNFAKWSNAYNDLSQMKYLERAFQINPNRVEPYVDLVSNYEFMYDRKKRDEYAKLWFDKGFTSHGLLSYNYNVLMSLKPNAILLTSGDNDTYPIWVLQAVKGIRKDVFLINIYMLNNSNYRKKVCDDLGIESIAIDDTEESEKKLKQELILKLSKNKQGRPVCSALSVDTSYTEPVSDNIYLTGLAYEYSTTKLDNIAVLKNNFENNFALDYLKNEFTIDEYAETMISFNTNYFVPLITLFEHYKLSGEMEKANKYKQLALSIAKKANASKEIEVYFKD
jgi:hypothetical protein